MHMNKILAQMLILIGNITYSESKFIGSFCESRSTRKLWFLINFCLWHPTPEDMVHMTSGKLPLIGIDIIYVRIKITEQFLRPQQSSKEQFYTKNGIAGHFLAYFTPLTDANKIKLTWNLLTGVLHLTRFHMSPNKDYWRSLKAMTPL